MNATRIFGIILLVIGAGLVIAGITASRSLADNLSTAFLGHLTKGTMWYFIGGIGTSVGGVLLLTGFGKRWSS